MKLHSGTHRAYCKVVDQDSQLFVELSAELYDVLSKAVQDRFTGKIELDFIDGNMGTSHVRISGKNWSKRVPRGIGSLIPGVRRNEAVAAP